MLESLIRRMIQGGADLEQTVAQAMYLSRQAYHKCSSLETLIDRAFGSQNFRRENIEPLLRKERQVESIRSRVKRGGQFRSGDKLQKILGQAETEYDTLNSKFPWNDLAKANRRLVSNYLDERRLQLELGDAERVKAVYQEAMAF